MLERDSVMDGKGRVRRKVSRRVTKEMKVWASFVDHQTEVLCCGTGGLISMRYFKVLPNKRGIED